VPGTQYGAGHFHRATSRFAPAGQLSGMESYFYILQNNKFSMKWKPFLDDASPPRWIKAKKKPELVPGKVVVTALANGWCSGINGMIERARQVSSEFGDNVVYREIDTSRRDAVREWGLSDGLFVNENNIYPNVAQKRWRKPHQTLWALNLVQIQAL
jgi:hypothetical protein